MPRDSYCVRIYVEFQTLLLESDPRPAVSALLRYRAVQIGLEGGGPVGTADTLHISMFGSFTMTRRVAGETLVVTDQSSSSKKLWTFLEYLIAFRSKVVSQDEIIDVLWGDSDIDNPVNTLKTLLHRARHAVEALGFENGKEIILYRRGTYRWNHDLDITVDTEQFESLCEAAARPGPDRLGHMLAAAALYRGDFLPKASHEPWAVSLRVYYHAKFLKLCAEAAGLLDAEGRYAETVDLCRRAILVDSYDEGMHLHLMQAMIATGAQQTAIQHYRYVTQLFMEQLGTSPSAELTALYRELVRSTQSVEMDLRVVRETLCEVRPNPGPYYCEYAIFQDVYRLSARTAARTGQVVQLAMLSVLDARGKPLTTRQISVSMSRVREVIHSGLRQGDAYTRFSATQYLLLLPCASYENGGKVLDRLVTSFRRIYPKMRVLLQYSVLPLMPLM